MTVSGLVQRGLRKYRQSGLRPLSQAGLYLLFESAPVRKIITNQVLKKTGVEPLDYATLRDHAESVGTRWQTFDTDGQSVVDIPRKTWIPDDRSFDDLQTDTPTPPEVLTIPDCTLIHPFGLTRCNRGIIQETITRSTSPSSKTKVEKAISKSVADHGYRDIIALLAGTATESQASIPVGTSLLMLWDNYYHWTIQCLPRLAGVERYREQTGKDPTLIIPEDPSSWMLESLELLGVSDQRLYRMDRHCHVEELVVPSHPKPSPAECRWLRERMHEAVGVESAEDTNSANRIYISRQGATRRRVRNEAAVMDTLRPYGFERYALEELSVAEQVRLFANAEAVVSPHGAGLANTVYADSTAVVELFGDAKKTTFYRLSDVLGHEYTYFHNPTDRGDIVVTIEQLEDQLSEVLDVT